MRVAFAMWPAPAHAYPLVPLAWALRAAGHEVSFISHPSIGPTITRTGLPFVAACDESAMPAPLGPGGAYLQERAEIDRITEALQIPAEGRVTWNTFSQFFLPSMWDFTPYRGSPASPMPAMDGIAAYFERWRPDLVIWDPCLPGAAVAARAVGARHARFSGPDIVGWCLDAVNRRTRGPGAVAVDNPLAETVRPMAEKFGVPVDDETLYGQWTINPMPPAISIPVATRTVPMRWLPFADQVAMPDWVYPVPDRPRIALSLGVSVRQYMDADWSYAATVLDALGDLDVEVVATLNAKQLPQGTKVPANVRVVDYVPLNYLAPTCSAIIHHGGLGTMISAASARVPQLVVDFPRRDVVAKASADGVAVPRYVLAPIIGGYVSDLGAGEILDLDEPDVVAIRHQVTRVLTEPGFRTGAARLHADLTALPNPADVVPILEKLTLSM